MKLRSSFLSALSPAIASAVLASALSLAGCDSDAKKAEPVKADVAVKADEPAKTEPAKVEPTPTPTPTDVKPADPAADTKAAETAGADTKVADAAGDTKAADAAGDTKEADPKPADAKATDTKTAEKKAAPKPPATPAIDGKPLYDSKCKVCHAANGAGTEAMKKNNVPDMSDKAWQGKHSKAAVVKAIANGVDGTKMKAFKDKLKPEEIDAIATYVKKLK